MRGVNWKATLAVALFTGSASAIDLNVNDESEFSGSVPKFTIKNPS
jgi:hypothetical protein